MKRYLVFMDKRFMSIGRRELALLAKSKTTEIKEFRTDNFIVVETDAEIARAAKDTIFIYEIIPLIAALKYREGINGEIVRSIEDSIGKKDPFRIEVINLESKSESSAKTAEVALGREMERDGFTADLKAPKIFVCVIFNQDNVLIGKIDSGMQSFQSIDEFRRFNKERDKISRAEFKLREAFEYFGVDAKGIGRALDIGAAPGGWTKMLHNMGISTIAVDNATLDSSILGNVTVLEDEKLLETAGNAKIIQIKKRAGAIDTDVLGKSGKFDMLLIDANISPKESADLALSFSSLLNSNAYLILTVKLIDYKTGKHISDVRDSLSKKFGSVRIKKLPYNRLELTVCARKS